MRHIVLPHGHGTVISSRTCLCKSSTLFPLASSNSDALPKTFRASHFSHTHIGITVAQKRSRVIEQRSIAPPAMWIAVRNILFREKSIVFLKMLDYRNIGAKPDLIIV